MKISPMSEAIRNKRAKGVDIAIILGGDDAQINDKAPAMDDSKDENKEMGLAPDAELLEDDKKPSDDSVVHDDEAQDKALIEQELAKAGLGKGSLSARAMLGKR